MPRASFVVVALSTTVAVVVASVLMLRPTGTETGSDGEDAREAVIVLDSVEAAGTRDTMSVVQEDLPESGAVRRTVPESEGRGEKPAATLPVREQGDVGEYLDPDALYPVSSYGEFQDPDRDVPTAPPHEGVSDVGEYLEPEERP